MLPKLLIKEVGPLPLFARVRLDVFDIVGAVHGYRAALILEGLAGDRDYG